MCNKAMQNWKGGQSAYKLFCRQKRIGKLLGYLRLYDLGQTLE